MSRHDLPLPMMGGIRAALRCYEIPPAAPEFEMLLARLAESEAALERARRGEAVATAPGAALAELAPSLRSGPAAACRPRAKLRAYGARWPRTRRGRTSPLRQRGCRWRDDGDGGSPAV